MDLRRAGALTAVAALLAAGCGDQGGATTGAATAAGGGAASATTAGRGAASTAATAPGRSEVTLRSAAFPVPDGWHVVDDTTRREAIGAPDQRIAVRRVVLVPAGATRAQLTRAQRPGDRWLLVEEWDDARGRLDAAQRRDYPRGAQAFADDAAPVRLDGRPAVRWQAASRPPESGATPYAEAGLRPEGWADGRYARVSGREVGVEASPQLADALDAIAAGWRWRAPAQ